jgi:hypothetical protein
MNLDKGYFFDRFEITMQSKGSTEWSGAMLFF